MWQMDQEGRFSLGADEFTRLIGPHTTASFGRLWREIAEAFGLDPDGRVMKAFATRQTWSGITLNWPVDGGAHLPVELSGLPIFDRARNFAGYRGFGVCRDLDGLARLAALRRYEFFGGAPAPVAPEPRAADIVQAGPAPDSVGAELPAQDLRRLAQDLSAKARLKKRCRKKICNAQTCPRTAGRDPSADFVIETSVARLRNCLSRSLTRLHTQPIWMPPWKPQRTLWQKCRRKRRRTFCRSAPRRHQAAIADAGRKQRLQRTRAAIVGAARDRDGQRDDTSRHRPR